MSPERWQKLEEIFQTALDRDPAERPAYIASACGDDPAMQADVEGLLAQFEQAGAFIEEPVLGQNRPFATLTGLVQSAEPPDHLIGTRVGPYLIEEEIGRGGMGKVYRAVRDDGSFSQQVAIKVVKRSMATEAIVRRFHRERQILAMVNHPNIARLFDGGSTPGGEPYFVMELIMGKPITSYCSDTRASLDHRLDLFRAVSAAVAHAHQNLIIHRDLKPANIMVTNEGQVKLLDFGIAKILQPDYEDAAQTRHAGETLLTPDYAAPEQVRSEPITTATDVYALGLILYELLTGKKAQRPTSSSLIDIERVVCETEPRRPSDVETEGVAYPARRLRGDLDNIVAKAIQKEPARRYPTVNQLAEDIERYQAARPVRARPDSFFYRSGKFVRRNRLGVAAAVIALASIIGGAGAAMWQARLAREHFDSVRTLAKSLLTEINPAIEDVPGTTKARHLIVKRSLEYLDKLSRTSTRDPELLKEQAEAYEAIATIQGNRNRSNLGDYAGAMNSFRRALQIRERIEQIAPSRDNRRWIAMISAEAARTYPETDEAVQLAQKSIEVAERLVQEVPTRPNKITLANAFFGLGYIRFRREEPDEAIHCFNRSRELGEETNRPKNNISVCDRYLAANYLMKHDAAAALRVAQRGFTLDEERVKKDSSPRAMMDFSYDFERIANAYHELGRLPDAIAMARKAEKMREDVAQGDANDQRANTGLADIHETLGAIYADAGRREESLDHLNKVIQARENFVKAAPESAEDLYELARTYTIAGKAFRRFGLCEPAGEMLAKARAILVAQKRKFSLADLDRVPACSAATPPGVRNLSASIGKVRRP